MRQDGRDWGGGDPAPLHGSAHKGRGFGVRVLSRPLRHLPTGMVAPLNTNYKTELVIYFFFKEASNPHLSSLKPKLAVGFFAGWLVLVLVF